MKLKVIDKHCAGIRKLIKTGCVILTFGFIFSLESCKQSNPPEINIYCNINVADITPKEPLFLAGFANRSGMSESVHRPLKTQCLALRRHNNTICMIFNDLMEVTPDIVKEITQKISDKTRLAQDHIFIHSNHTHSAPIMDNMGLEHSEANDHYRGEVIKTITANAVKTLNDSTVFAPFSISTGHSTCDINVNRRAFDPDTGETIIGKSSEGICDQEVGIVQLSDKAGKSIITLFNYACHPVTLGYESRAVSPDYIGRAREVIQQNWGGIATFMNGAAGDINPARGLGVSTELADAEGEILGNAVVSARLKEGSALSMQMRTATIELPYLYQNITSEQIDRIVMHKSEEETEFLTWKQDVHQWGNKMKDLQKKGKLDNYRKMKTGVVRLGPALIFFTQGEIFNTYQTILRKSFPDQTILFVGYTNGESGYLPDKEAFSFGGYEVEQAYIYIGEPSPLSPEAEMIFLDHAREQINSVL